jgi:hypothetical protein
MYEKAFFFTRFAYLRQLPYQHLLHIVSPTGLISKRGISTYETVSFKNNIFVRNMVKEDLQLVFQWADREGWNPGKHEIEPFYAADPNGYYMLEVDGKPAASLAAVKYSSSLAFLGLFVVVPELRGQGYGNILWDIVTRKIEVCTSIGLNGVMEQIARYEKSGFRSRFLNTRWQGTSDNIPGEKGIKKEGLFLTDKFSTEALVKYDGSIFSTPRASFLTQWLKMPESHVLVALDTQNNIVGYGVISRTIEGYKIAPLFSNSEIIADQLYRGLCSFTGKETIISIDIAETNPYATALVERFKLEKLFDTMRMYKGEAPKIDQQKIVGLTSLEIGG